MKANAALRSIVRRDTGESYHDFLTTLAQASVIETPTRADLARIDRKRKKKRAHKAEHVVDLETGAIVGVTVQGGSV